MRLTNDQVCDPQAKTSYVESTPAPWPSFPASSSRSASELPAADTCILERKLALAFFTGRVEALNVVVPWNDYPQISWKIFPTLGSLLPACTVQLHSCLLAPFGPATVSRRSTRTDGTALAVIHALRHFICMARFRVSYACVLQCGDFSRAVDEFARTLEMGCDAVGVPREGPGTTAGVLHMPPQVLLVYYYPPIPTLLAALNGLRLLAPAALLADLAKVLDTSLSKAFRTLLEAPLDEAREAATAFLRLLVPFVRKGLNPIDRGCVDPALGMYHPARRCRIWERVWVETKEATIIASKSGARQPRLPRPPRSVISLIQV